VDPARPRREGGELARAPELRVLELDPAQACGDADVEVVKTYSVDDADGLVPEEMAAQLGAEKTAELMTAFVSAFVKATKPERSCCCG
jgi:DNA polymerase III alpha subunit (gram-positive type)